MSRHTCDIYTCTVNTFTCTCMCIQSANWLVLTTPLILMVDDLLTADELLHKVELLAYLCMCM